MVKFLTLLILFALLGASPSFAQLSIASLSPIPISVNTGEKPQSKVWAHAGTFWTVLPDREGTHVWQLNDHEWVKKLTISSKTTTKADCKVVGDVTHVLLFHESIENEIKAYSELVTLAYSSIDESYTPWPNSRESLYLGTYVEVATIDIDSEARMWLVYAAQSLLDEKLNDVVVRWSDFPYDVWSEPIIIESKISDDDIAAVIALPTNQIGVIWSNQVNRRFGFRIHIDGTDPVSWFGDEQPASQSALKIGKGMADDHLNMAIARDGTLYCAVKTSYNDAKLEERFTEVALMVRKPDGIWDNLYEVSKQGTRPIVILNETEEVVRIFYTDNERGGNIVYKESSVADINFGQDEIALIRGTYNNVTSTKDNFTDEIVIMASNRDGTQAVSVLTKPTIPLPVELISFTARLSADDAVLQWKTASEQDNDYFSIESSTDGRNFTSIGRVAGNGTTQLQQHYSFTDHNISRYRANTIYYRLRQVDFSGEYKFSFTRYVTAPALPDVIVLKAFPSPFNNYLQVQINSNEMQTATISLYNAQGRNILTELPKLNLGLNNIILSELNLVAGIYFLKVTAGGQQRTLKVVCE